MSRWTPRLTVLVATLLAISALTACSRADTSSGGSTSGGTAAAEVRLGYFPNVTHASAIIGVDRGFFAGELGATLLTTQTFNAGPDEVNALLGGSLDIGFIGSGPAINAFAKSKGETIRVISGATSGGAQLVVKPGITSPEQLKGKTIATPQLGNTQDIALKKWLKDKGLTAGDGPNDVKIANLENPRTLDAFKQGSVDGGWLPEPWSSRLVVEAGATVLLDEKTLWPDGKFPTTVIVVRTEFLKQHPDTVQAVLRGHTKALDYAAASPNEAKPVVNDGLKKLTGSQLSGPVLDRAFTGISLGYDPLATTYTQLAKDSVTAGVTPTQTDLAGFLDLSALNAVLKALGRSAVDAGGLDKPKGS